MIDYEVWEKKFYAYKDGQWRLVQVFQSLDKARRWIRLFGGQTADYRIDRVTEESI